jgi:hypothetical protein
VPEAAVHEDGEARMAESEIGAAGDWLVSPPAIDTGGAENGDQLQFGGFVAAGEDGGHDLAAFLLRKYVGHRESLTHRLGGVMSGKGSACGGPQGRLSASKGVPVPHFLSLDLTCWRRARLARLYSNPSFRLLISGADDYYCFRVGGYAHFRGRVRFAVLAFGEACSIRNGGLMKLLLAVACGMGLLLPESAQTQGTTVYVSNLGQPSSGTFSVGSDSWLAWAFLTGADPGGYTLDAVQFAMANATGNPSGFRAMLYSEVSAKDPVPGTDLGTLSGSADPAAAGVFSYVPPSSLALAPNGLYFIVVTGGTPVGDGAFEWSVAGGAYQTGDGWVGTGIFGGSEYESADGSTWTFPGEVLMPQLAISASVVPEPGTIVLTSLSLVLVAWRSRVR